MNPRDNTKLGVSLALIAATCFAVSDIAAKWLTEFYPLYQIIFYNGFFAAVTLVLLSPFMKGSLKTAFKPAYPKLMLLRIACIVSIGYVNVFAFSKIPLADAYALLFTGPIISSLLSVFVLKDVVHKKEWLYIIGGFIGVLVVLRPGFSDIGIGSMAALLGAFIVALMNNVARKMGDKDSPLTLCFMPLLGDITVSALLLLTIGHYVPVRAAFDWLPFIGGGIFLALGFVIIAKAYSSARVAVVSPMGYSQMIWALLSGWLIFGDKADPIMLVGVAVIIASGIGIIRSGVGK